MQIWGKLEALALRFDPATYFDRDLHKEKVINIMSCTVDDLNKNICLGIAAILAEILEWIGEFRACLVVHAC